MGRICVVEACGSEYYPGCGLSFHRFPKDPNVREIWINIIPMSSNRKLTDASVVCSKHFKAQDFVACLSRSVLKCDAVPSVFVLALATVASCLISVSNGFTIGVSSFMIPQLRNDTSIHFNPHHESWLASISVMSMIIGSLSAGSLLDRCGRKFAHIVVEIPLIIGWIIIAASNSTTALLMGRFITGLSAGSSRPINMVYIGEITDPKIRASALFAPGLSTPLGIWISHMTAYYCGWRASSVIFIIPAVISLVAILFFKESPLWLIAKGRHSEGIENFRWFRGTDDTSEAELKSILEKHSEEANRSDKNIFKIISSRAFIQPMLILAVIMIDVQISGINSLSFYTSDVFEKVFPGTIDPFTVTMLMDGTRNLISLIICMIGNLLPRKWSYLITNFGVTLFSCGLVACFETTNVMWVSMTCLVMFVLCASTGMVVGYTFVPELLPTAARGFGSGLISMLCFLTLFITVKILPDLVRKFGVSGLFVCYGTGTVICGLILTFVLPETNGRTLQSIENSFNEKKIDTK